MEIDSRYDEMFKPQKRGWLGADGAASVSLDKNRILWVFGDTALGNVRGGKREGPMVNNTIAIQDRSTGSPGTITYHWDFTDNLPGSFFHDGYEAKHFYWPGTGVTHAGGVFLFLTRVGSGEGGDGFAFHTLGCELFKIGNTAAPPEEWRILKSDLGVGDDHFNINAASIIEGQHVYLLGYHDPEDDPKQRVAILARLPLTALTASKPGQAIEYWSNDGTWKSTRDDLAPLFKPGMTETSLYFDPVRRRYITSVIRPFQPDLCLVSAESLTGPWTEPQKIYDIPDLQINDLIHAYAGRIHPALSTSPDELVITYVSNTTDFWSVFGMLDIYYPRFVRVTLDPVAEPAAKPESTEAAAP